jgi:hypothetical protein
MPCARTDNGGSVTAAAPEFPPEGPPDVLIETTVVGTIVGVSLCVC